jgi:hypothetical protein
VGGGAEAWGEEAWLVGVERGASAQEKGFACRESGLESPTSHVTGVRPRPCLEKHSTHHRPRRSGCDVGEVAAGGV